MLGLRAKRREASFSDDLNYINYKNVFRTSARRDFCSFLCPEQVEFFPQSLNLG